MSLKIKLCLAGRSEKKSVHINLVTSCAHKFGFCMICELNESQTSFTTTPILEAIDFTKATLQGSEILIVSL